MTARCRAVFQESVGGTNQGATAKKERKELKRKKRREIKEKKEPVVRRPTDDSF